MGHQNCEGCKGTPPAAGPEIDRRAFLAQGTIAAVAAVLAVGCAAAATGTSHVNETIAVGDFPALSAVGGVARVDGGSGGPVAAVRTGQASFAAFSLVCPHYGCTVGVYNGSTPPFQCPCHGAEFAGNGQWYGGQPTGNLRALTTAYDASTGTLTITG
jgi:Rieske Fe-S protein